MRVTSRTIGIQRSAGEGLATRADLAELRADIYRALWIQGTGIVLIIGGFIAIAAALKLIPGPREVRVRLVHVIDYGVPDTAAEMQPRIRPPGRAVHNTARDIRGRVADIEHHHRGRRDQLDRTLKSEHPNGLLGRRELGDLTEFVPPRPVRPDPLMILPSGVLGQWLKIIVQHDSLQPLRRVQAQPAWPFRPRFRISRFTVVRANA